MADTTENRNPLHETVFASGTVYLTLDSQLVYWRRFERHISVNVVYDNGDGREKSQGSSFISNDQIGYERTPCSSNLALSNHVQDVPVYYSVSRPISDSIDASNGLSAISESRTDNDGNGCRVIEMASSKQDTESKNSECLNSFDSHIKHGGGSITNSSNIDVSDEEVDNKHESVSVNRNSDNGASLVNKEATFKEIKRSSERLSNISMKHNRKSLTKVLLKEKSEDIKCKIKNAKKSAVTLLKRTSKIKKTNKNVKKLGNREICKKLPSKTPRDTVEDTPRATKVKKLELEKDVKCDYCSQNFKSQQEYFDHRKGERSSFRCKICGKTVPFKAHLIVHMQKHNNLQDELPPLEEIAHKSDQESQAAHDSKNYKNCKQIKCDVCGLTVSNIPILKTHTMIHTGEYAYRCCICGEKTHSIAKHNNHLSTHLKSGKVQCKICNISFESRSDLSRHQLTHDFKCSICNKVFPNKTSRVFHYKMLHKDDILKCKVCGKMFSSEEELTPHLKYHRNRAKTQCTICGLFVTRLDNHILSHNQRAEDSKMYVCDQCPKQFKQKLSFQRHMRTHSEEKPYSCMECSKRFARSGGLRRHMITHTQEKPFVCNICGKACSQMGNLRIHMQIHKEIFPVQCKVCGEGFSHKSGLQEHMMNIHADVSVEGALGYVTTGNMS